MAFRSSKKQFILDTAASLFQEKGYRATSMRELAQAVNLEPSSLYSHISSKQELLHLICFDCSEKFIEGINRIEQLENDPIAKITEVISMHIHIAIESPSSVTVFTDEWKHLIPEYLTTFLQDRRIYEEKVKNILVAGIEAGQIKPMDPQILFYYLLNSLRWIYMWYTPKRKVNADDLAEDISHLILDGLKNS